MIVKCKRQARRTAGTMVETAVVSLACFLFMFALFEFGRVIMLRNLLENAARSGARVTIVLDADAYSNPTQLVTDAVTAALAGADLQNINIQVYQSNSAGTNTGSWTSAPFGQNIIVQIDADVALMFPAFGWVPQSGAAPN